MKFTLLRHATLLLEIAGKKILVDPMLGRKDSMDPVANAENSFRIPMVDLPVSDDELKKILQETDAVMVTHTHRDHWDAAAQELIAKDKLIICQPADEEKFHDQGFNQVQVVASEWVWNNIHIYRTNGQHGTGEIGKKMAPVSGFVLVYDNQKLYIAGDTIWCDDVEEAITEYQPSHIIANGGGARFLEGDPITMTTRDVLSLTKYSQATVIVVYLDTVNHCLEKRDDFKKAVAENDLEEKIIVPEDGEWLII